MPAPGLVNFELFEKWKFVTDTDKWVFGTQVIGTESIAARAIAVCDAYSFGFMISAWLILGDVLN
jgi:hypothetical protein